MKKSVSGFTIVELLIVIVVIAILAAISIVAYNGVQARARVSVKQASISTIQKQAEVYRAEFDNFPVVNSGAPDYAALGLQGMQDKVVLLDQLIYLTPCLAPPMTKDKYCVASDQFTYKIIWWNDLEGRWLKTDKFDTSPHSGNVDLGTGAYPNNEVY